MLINLLCGVRKAPCRAWQRYPGPTPHNYRRHITHKMWCTTFDAGNPHVRFDERGGETGRGKRHRALPRLYCPLDCFSDRLTVTCDRAGWCKGRATPVERGRTACSLGNHRRLYAKSEIG
jgi:hypothetical protein